MRPKSSTSFKMINIIISHTKFEDIHFAYKIHAFHAGLRIRGKTCQYNYETIIFMSLLKEYLRTK